MTNYNMSLRGEIPRKEVWDMFASRSLMRFLIGAAVALALSSLSASAQTQPTGQHPAAHVASPPPAETKDL